MTRMAIDIESRGPNGEPGVTWATVKRTERELRKMIDGAIEETGGVMPLDLLVTPEEEAKVREMLKGRRGVKSLTLKVAASPAEFLPMSGLVPIWRD